MIGGLHLLQTAMSASMAMVMARALMPAHSSETDASSRNKCIASETFERRGGRAEPLAPGQRLRCGWAERYEEGCSQWQQFRLGFSLVRSSVNEMTRHLSQQLSCYPLPRRPLLCPIFSERK